MKLSDLIQEIENNKNNIGIFSKTHKTMGKGHTYDIPFALKPAQQVLASLGTVQDTHQPPLLTAKGNVKTTGNTDIKVTSFMPKVHASDLTIVGKRIDNLFASAKIYLDSSIISADNYRKIVAEKLATQSDEPSALEQPSWKNLAVGICHAQEIDLLVDTYPSEHWNLKKRRSHITVKPEGSFIPEDAPTILLLSSPRLDLSKEHDKALKKEEEQAKYITSMYRNLFHAAITEGREYLVMPAAGLGKNNGSPKMYFKILMTVAAEYPKLNIIYNAGEHNKDFSEALRVAGTPENVGQTTKDIIGVARYLNSNKRKCAVHNPSSSEAVYGLIDVGGYWQADPKQESHGKNPSQSLEAYIGTISTAPLGSYGINPEAYSRIIEMNLKDQVISIPEPAPVPMPSIPDLPSTPTMPIPPTSDIPPQKPDVIPPQIPSTQPDGTDKPQTPTPVPPSPDESKTPPAPSTKPKGPGSDGMFPPKPSTPTTPPHTHTSSLSPLQFKEVNDLIDELTMEINSCWPIYFNKDLKQIKINALNDLIIKARTLPLEDALEEVKTRFPRVLEGHWSTRTATLFNDLERSTASIKL
jgi:hypothetical protein